MAGRGRTRRAVSRVLGDDSRVLLEGDAGRSRPAGSLLHFWVCVFPYAPAETSDFIALKHTVVARQR